MRIADEAANKQEIENIRVEVLALNYDREINKDAGRDHWAQAASLLFAGAGVKPGFILGATDKLGAFVTRRPVSPPDVACTIFESLGIDPRKQLLSPDGRPIEILDQGEPVRELYV